MENNFELPSKVKRVDALRETDDPKEDSVEELAYKEKEFREDLEKEGMPKENIGKMADKISDETLEKIEAEKMALLDPLTGLGNRRALEKTATIVLKVDDKKPVEIEEKRKKGSVERRKNHASLIMLDLDYFKEVNDSYGHPAGDKVLKEISEDIEKVLRKREALFRTGGEEFVVFLPDTNLDMTIKVAERIRKSIERLVIKTSDGHEIKITASLGCSSTDQISNKTLKEDYLDTLISNADIAVYKAKEGNQDKEGRNQVVAFEEIMKKEKKD